MDKAARIRVYVVPTPANSRALRWAKTLAKLKRQRRAVDAAIAVARARFRAAQGDAALFGPGLVERWLGMQIHMGRVKVEHCRPYFASPELFREAAKACCMPISEILRAHVLRYPADFWERRVSPSVKPDSEGM